MSGIKRDIIALHEQTREYVFPLDRNSLLLRLRIQRKAAKKCKVIYWNRNKPDEGTYEMPMECYASDGMFDYFETLIKTEKATRYLNYYFSFQTNRSKAWLNYFGIRYKKPEGGFFEYSYTNDKDVYHQPEGACGSVFYQIFPDRFFRNSDNTEKVSEWGRKPTRDNFMGGNLKGIREKIQYLYELGINAVYLNPVFLSPSNHKYDTVNYYEIDPYFGTKEDLIQLVSYCHEKGMRVILDGVFNHCGYDSPIFQDVLKHGEASRYSDWFYIENFPVDEKALNYETIGYYYVMPKLRLSNEEVRQYILNIALYWMDIAHIDGWRLDVAEEMEYPFLQYLRKELKAKYCDCFLLAETWRENPDMLRGDQMDSITNYVLRNALIDFFAKSTINTIEFDQRVNRIIGVYSKPFLYQLFNTIDSHDTERFLTSCDDDTRKMKMAVAFQFAFPGIPVVYYGDETGMEGETDPDCRRAMAWDKNNWNADLNSWYRMLIGLLKSSRAIRYGSYLSIYANHSNGVYSFIRSYEDECIYFVFNNSAKKEKIKLPVMEQNDGCLTDITTGNVFIVQPSRQDLHCYNDFAEIKGSAKLLINPYEVMILKNTVTSKSKGC